MAFGEGGIQYTFARTLCIATYHLDTFLVTVLASDLISAICILLIRIRPHMKSLLLSLVRYSIADASICEERISRSVVCR